MATAQTIDAYKYVLEIETATAGTYAKVCGIKETEISRETEVSEVKVPDCDDLSKPLETVKSITGRSMSVNCSGVMAKQSSDMLTKWWHAGGKKKVRLAHLYATTGEIEYEAAEGILSSLSDSVKLEGEGIVQRQFQLDFSGAITTSNKA